MAACAPRRTTGLNPMGLYDLDAGDREALPTDGMDVEEVRDPDSLRRFVLDWHRCDRHGGAESIVVRPPHHGDRFVA